MLNCIGKTLNLFEVNVRETEECTIQRNCMTRFGKKRKEDQDKQNKTTTHVLENKTKINKTKNTAQYVLNITISNKHK